MLIIIDLIIKCIFSSYIIYQSGNIFSKILSLKSNRISFCEKSFLGIIFISFIGLFLNFFFPLNYTINSIFFSFLIVSFFIDRSFPFKQIIIIGLVTSLILLFAKTNNPDGGLYHLPYIQILNEEKIIFGLNNLHFRFALVSMFQYVSALFNNLYLGIEGVTIPIAIIVSYFLYFLHHEIFKLIKKYTKINSFISIIYVILLVSSLYSFNRYSNYGNDVSLHIFYFLIFLLSLNYFFIEQNKDTYNLVLIFSAFLIINKITYILVILFPIIIFFNLKQKKIINPTNFFIFVFFLLWALKNILISGCIIFPIPFLCFEMIEWSNLELVNQEKLAGEAWSKGWPDQKTFDDHSTFISNYNWLSTWFGKHFLVVLEKFIPIILFIIIFSFIFLVKGEKIELINNKFYKIKLFQIYLISLLNFLLWFNFFPIYRYGYAFILIFTILSILLLTINKFNITEKIFIKKYYTSILVIGYMLFCLKNIDKIYENYNQNYVGKPFPNIYYSNFVTNLPKIEKKMIKNKFIYYHAPNLCFYNKAPCTNYLIENLNFKTLFNYKVLYLNK